VWPVCGPAAPDHQDRTSATVAVPCWRAVVSTRPRPDTRALLCRRLKVTADVLVSLYLEYTIRYAA